MTPKLGEDKKILEVNQEAGFRHIFGLQWLVKPCEENIIFSIMLNEGTAGPA